MPDNHCDMTKKNKKIPTLKLKQNEITSYLNLRRN